MIFTPAHVDGRELVDGGLLAPVPIAATRQMRVDRVIAVDVNGPVAWMNGALEPRHEEIDACHGDDEDPALVSGGGLRERMASLWDGIATSVTPTRHHTSNTSAKSRSVMDLMSRSLDTMQGQLSRLQLALDPPDLLIRVPRDICLFHEFWRASELIEIGREAAQRALAAARS
jgi:NTE family protein